MELILWALLLTVAQGLCHVPAGAVAFVGLPGGVRAVPGPGFRLWNPWPAARAGLAGPLPFRLERAELISDAPLRRVGGDPFGGGERRFALRDVEDLGFRGTVLRINGRPFALCISKEQARAAIALIEALRAAPAADVQSTWDAWLEHSFSLAAFREQAARVDGQVRWLRWLCAAQAVVAFVVTPALLLRFDDALGFLLAAPALGSLHLTAVVLLARGHRRLCPDAAGDRLELLFTAMLYPPLLFRGPEMLSRTYAARFHPAVVAAAWLPERERIRTLRRAFGRARHSAETGGIPDAGGELAGRLAALAAEAEIPEFALSGPPATPEADAASYCPVCDAGYRAGFDRCGSCDVATLPVPQQA